MLPSLVFAALLFGIDPADDEASPSAQTPASTTPPEDPVDPAERQPAPKKHQTPPKPAEPEPEPARRAAGPTHTGPAKDPVLRSAGVGLLTTCAACSGGLAPLAFATFLPPLMCVSPCMAIGCAGVGAAAGHGIWFAAGESLAWPTAAATGAAVLGTLMGAAGGIVLASSMCTDCGDGLTTAATGGLAGAVLGASTMGAAAAGIAAAWVELSEAEERVGDVARGANTPR